MTFSGSNAHEELAASADVRRVSASLLERFCPPLRPEAVERCVLDCLVQFEGAPVRQYVPVLLERVATERLLAVVRSIERAPDDSADPVG